MSKIRAANERRLAIPKVVPGHSGVAVPEQFLRTLPLLLDCRSGHGSKIPHLSVLDARSGVRGHRYGVKNVATSVVVAIPWRYGR